VDHHAGALVLALLLPASVACATPGAGKAETRQRSEVLELRASVDNERVRVSLRNGSPHVVGANLCRLHLEVEGEAGWGAMQAPVDSDCVDEQRALVPGEEISTALWSRHWSRQPMRLKLSVEVPAGGFVEEVTSPHFRANWSGDSAGEGDFDDFGRPIEVEAE
jgi:hypothetical protein